MPSPFSAIPESDWTASNQLAFAFRDQYAVTEGHTLVVPRREVATWFDATEAEQHAIMALVAVVKAQLESELSPDGYNVGFNAGAAAGQTVFHLHVHVIPRHEGDMHDPRGGVRHVIPSRGNYRAAHQTLTLGGEDDPFMRQVRPLFEGAMDVAIVAAFVQRSGLDRLRDLIERALRRGARIRVLTGDYLHITQAEALEDLLGWMSAGPEDSDESDDTEACEDAALGRLEARIIEVAELPKRTRAFHPKSWRFEGPAMSVLFVGSSNLSRSALDTGIEWNLRVDKDRDEHAYERAVAGFERLWNEARGLDAAWVADYAARAQIKARPLAESEVDDAPTGPPPTPHDVQREALDKLCATRTTGHRRGLVVLATGLGKTWLACFDVERFADEIGRPPRVLFVAHRREILRQAARTFRTMARARWPGHSVTWFAGPGGSLDGDFVFASVQKLGRAGQLAKLEPRAFDYVVIDEVHHAAAPSYRRILDYLDPVFVLGLTATPERADQADVLGLFDDNLVHRADLGRGIEVGRLVPFDYFGIKDEVDYAAIPWRNRGFDPVELARAVQTQRRMESLWGAWQAHTGGRTIVFCASVAHANYARDWLRARAVRVEAIHTGDDADDRDAALEKLRRGELDAVCSVDVLNEGVDVPAVDRVVMLRPTESPVVFLQQLGRGLRRFDDSGKTRLTVIDFVGNHRMFLDRMRRLLSLAGPSAAGALQSLIEASGLVELPSGCSVHVELEAKDLLARLMPRGGGEVQRVYRELRESRGIRPTAGELQRLGYLPSTLRKSGHASWFDFVKSEGDLTEAQLASLSGLGPFLSEVETTNMTKAFKMVLLEALLEADAMQEGLPISELAARSHRVLRRSPELWKDVADKERFDRLEDTNAAAWQAYWRKNPVAAWMGENNKRTRAWFRIDGDWMVPDLPWPATASEAAVDMVRELVDYRLAKYRARHGAPEDLSAFDCKLTWNQRDPILKLPSRAKRSDVPEGDTEVRLPGGEVWTFGFRKQFCNTARPPGERGNQLPDLLRGWFGPSAGHPGTDFHVRFAPSPDGWWLERLGEVLQLRTRGRLRTYPDLRAAAGAVTEAHDHLEADEVVLPAEVEGDDVFALRAAGSSMHGGSDPIRDGDWLVLRLCRGEPLPAVEGRIALLQISDPDTGNSFQLKRIVRDSRGAGWILRSDNRAAKSFTATADTTPIAKLVATIPPERLAPQPGALVPEAQLAEAFGLDERPTTGRVGGHLFFMVETPGALIAPDRLQGDVLPKPGETAFVLTRADPADPWRYCGVGRRAEIEGQWTVPSLDHRTWKRLGTGRKASRTLPPESEERARALVHKLLVTFPTGAWIEARGRRARIAGQAAHGGLRIDGGEAGFAERTVSLTDLAWALVAQDRVELEAGVLDEAQVNRLRYLEGTPKAATRWIDTGWALVVLSASASEPRG